MNKMLQLCSLLAFFWVSDIYASQAVFSGIPSIRIKSSSEGTERTELPDVEKTRNLTHIIKVDGNYLWLTRNAKQLVHTTSGVYHHFVDPEGGGYVKVINQEMLPKEMRNGDAKYRYMVHLNFGLSTITYWGESEEFNP